VILNVVSYLVSRKDKLTAKLLSRPTDMRFSEVELVLKWHGFSSNTQGTSHRVYKGNGKRITIAIKGGQVVKRVYLEEIIRVLGLEKE